MTQQEFDNELRSGKRSWPGSHVDGDLDISSRIINGDLDLDGLNVTGDLDLSETTIEGSLFISQVSVGGNLYLNGLRVVGRCAIQSVTFMYVLGEVIADDFSINGHQRRLPRMVIEKDQLVSTQ